MILGSAQKFNNPKETAVIEQEEQIVIEQAKIERVFLMITLLCRKELSVKSICYRMNWNYRTTYRYVNLLKGLGFQIIKHNTSDGIKYSIGNEFRPAFMEHLMKEISNG